MRGYVELRRPSAGAHCARNGSARDATWRGPARGRPGMAGRAPGRVDQCLSSAFFGFGGDGTFAYWNAGVAFSASFVAPGR